MTYIGGASLMTKVMGMRRRTFQFCHRAHFLLYNFPEAIFTGAMPDQGAFTLQLCDHVLHLPLCNAQCSDKTFAVSSPQRRVRMQRLERGGRAGILTNFKRQTGNLFRRLKGKSIPIAHHLFLRSCGSSVRYGRISVQVQDVSQCCVFLRPGVPAPSSTRGSSPAGCFIRYVPFLYKSHCVTAEKPFSPGKLREDAVITGLSVIRLVGPVSDPSFRPKSRRSVAKEADFS